MPDGLFQAFLTGHFTRKSKRTNKTRHRRFLSVRATKQNSDWNVAMPQIKVHPDHLDVQLQVDRTASTGVNVFQVARRLLARFKALLAAVIAAELAARLKRELGPCGQSGNRFEGTGGLACPDCGSGAANRKSWRDRIVEIPRLGGVEIKRPYVKCRNCGRAFTPYDAGIPDQRRYGWEGLRRPLEATVETSYRCGEEAYPESPSRSTLWRRVQEQQPALGEPLFEEGQEDRRTDSTGSDADEGIVEGFAEGTCVADATRIPAREEEAHHSLSIAHVVRPDREGGPGGRPALQRKAVAARVGSETRLRDALQDVPIQSLVTDGQMDVSGVAPYRGRCRWHVPRTVRFRFYDDNVAGERNEELTGSIRGVAYADYANGHAAKATLTRWSAACRLLAPKAATAVERAAEGIAVYAEAPGAFCVESTAPAEREMRELNRRFENGGQWTRLGAENLLQYHQLYRHAPGRWAQWFAAPDPPG